MYKILIALYFIIVIIFTKCPANYQLSQFQENSIQFYIPQTYQQEYIERNFQSSLSKYFSSIPSVAISISQIQYFGTQNQSIQQFMFYTQKVSHHSILFKFKALKREWKKLSIKYWVSCRSDIMLGRKVLEFKNIEKKKFIQIQTQMIGQNYRKSIVRAFLNGVNVKQNSNQLQVSIQGRNYKQNAILLQILSGSQTQLKVLWFSYVIYIITTTSLNSYGGIILQQSFDGINYKNIYNQNSLYGYLLVGITKLKVRNQLTFRFQIDADYLFSYQVNGKSVNLGISYIVIGIFSKDLCYECQQKNYYKGNCLNTCPESTYLSRNENFSFCKTCPSKLNMVLNKQQTGCQCRQNYVELNSRCIQAEKFQKAKPLKVQNFFLPDQKNLNNKNQIKKNQIIQANCILKPNTFWDGEQCVCKKGYILNQKTLICEKQTNPKCPNSKSCICNKKNQTSQYDVCKQNLCSKLFCESIQNQNCGNGIIEQGQYCDDGNIFNRDGCSITCNVQPNSVCYNESPSICYQQSYNLRLVKDIYIQRQNIFLEIQTQPAFKFKNQKQMKKFLQFQFKNQNQKAQTIDCFQRQQRLNRFYCKLGYPSGLPQEVFKIIVRFQNQGQRGYIGVIIDKNSFHSIFYQLPLK